jgi:hypothetical protein
VGRERTANRYGAVAGQEEWLLRFCNTVGSLWWKTSNSYFKRASSEDSESSQHKEMLSVWSDRYASYPDLIITYYKHYWNITLCLVIIMCWLKIKQKIRNLKK